MRGWWLTLATLVACDRHHDAPAPAPPPAAPAPAAPASCSLAPLPLRVPAGKRTVAIGDFHGDLSAARLALRAAGAIDAEDRWIGGELTIVQLGDVLDRGDDESRILELLERLDRDARAAGGGGGIVQLLGNHELMNAAHDFRYVTPGGARDFGGDREHVLGPGGAWGKRLAAHDIVAIVGDTVLSHAGVLPAWVDRLDAINLEARCWLDGQTPGPASALTSDDSPVWTRAWGGPDADCQVLDAVLAKLGARRMVVAHTVQPHGITSACDGKLWRIDVGLAALYGGPIHVLELGDPPKILEVPRK